MLDSNQLNRLELNDTFNDDHRCWCSSVLSLIISTVVQLEKRLVFRTGPSEGSPEADLSDDAYYTPLS